MCMKGQWAAYKEVGHAQTLMMQRVAANKATWEQVDAGLCTKWAGVGFHALPSSRTFGLIKMMLTSLFGTELGPIAKPKISKRILKRI